jgi:hypothetical protein
MVFFISFITTLAIYQIVKHIFYYRNSKSYSGEVKQKVQNTISQSNNNYQFYKVNGKY